jgi:hypothetical protein
MERILYKTLASSIQARATCKRTGNTEWFEKHSRTISQLVKNYMPRGSGWDSGTEIDLDRSHADKLVFYGSFHHMNENGMYDGWTEHTVTVTPSLVFDLNIRITGRNRNDIKEHLHEMFHFALSTKMLWNHQTNSFERKEEN